MFYIPSRCRIVENGGCDNACTQIASKHNHRMKIINKTANFLVPFLQRAHRPDGPLMGLNLQSADHNSGALTIARIGTICLQHFETQRYIFCSKSFVVLSIIFYM